MQGKAESSVLHKAQEPWGGCWKAVGSGVTTISPGGSGHMERVEIEAPFSYLCHLCLSTPGLLALLLFPMGPTAQNSKGESGEMWRMHARVWVLSPTRERRRLIFQVRFRYGSLETREVVSSTQMPRVF